jgi:LysR family glycine cleavage system transcriptional activator
MFHRTPAGVELTPAGKQLRKLTEKPVAALEAAALKLRRAPDRMKLRLSVVTSLGNLWLMPRLEQFRRTHPEVDLEFRTYLPNETFAREDVDLWIDLKPGAQHQWPRQISARYLIGQEIVAVCAPSLARGIRNAADVLERPILYHSNYPINWETWSQAAGVKLPRGWKGSGFDLVANLIGAARSGLGVAVVQRCMIEADLAGGALVLPVDVTATTGRGYYLCRRRAQPAHAAADLFAQWVAEQARLSLRA